MDIKEIFEYSLFKQIYDEYLATREEIIRRLDDALNFNDDNQKFDCEMYFKSYSGEFKSIKNHQKIPDIYFLNV